MDVKEILLTYISGNNRAGLAYDILTAKRIENEKCLELYGFKVYSQNDEDGIIEEIFNRIGTTDKTFVEFGVENGLECNSHYLLHKGWRGLWLEGNEKAIAEIYSRFYPAIKTGQLKCRNAFITKDNINELIAEGGIVGEIDLLSVDIDGNDYYVWQAINVVKPRVVIVEYNAKFPPNHAWKQAYNAKHQWDGSDWMGASLKALELLGRELGYQLVGTDLSGVNAFFVRQDLATDHFIEPATSEALYNPARYYSTLRYISGHQPKFYLGNQEPNIGALNYNPQEINYTGTGFPPEIKAKARAKIKSSKLAATDMIYQPVLTHSKFFLPLAHDDLIQQYILLSDNYFESGMLQEIFYNFKGGLLSKLVGQNDSIVVDLGANIGNHTLFFANELHAGKVISFEPVPDTFKILQKNIQLNNLEDKVELHNEGLSDKPGHAVIASFNEGNIGGTSLKQGEGTLVLTTLDSLNLKKITMIKIDVEGMEPQALEGARDTITRLRPFIMTEAFSNKAPLVEDFFRPLNYCHFKTSENDYLFYPAEYDNWHDAELENYDIVLRAESLDADRLERNRSFIEKYLGHEKIIVLNDERNPLPIMSYALECEKEYYLAWSAGTVPLRAMYFINRRQELSSYAGLDCMLIKTSVMREFIDALGGLKNVEASNVTEIEAYRNFVAEKYPKLYVEKELKIISEETFGRTLTADELRLLPFDVIINKR